MNKLSYWMVSAALAVAVAGCGAGNDPVAPKTVLDTAPPQAPSGLTQAVNGSLVRVLEWTANSEADLAGYQIYQYSPDPGRDNAYVLVATVSASTTEWTLPATDEMETSWIRLRALDQSGNRSAESAAAQVVLLPANPSDEPAPDDPDPIRP